MTESSSDPTMATDCNPGESLLNDLVEALTNGENGRVAELAELDFGKPDHARLRDASGNTILHFAIASGSDRLILSLLARGALVNTVNHRGLSPLHLAVLLRRTGLVQTLLEYGAD